jgi:hypothetical protein
VFVPPPGVTRRAFLKAAVAGVALPSPIFAQATKRETLYNGIVLPTPWPPRRVPPVFAPQKPPYLAAPPPIINIEIGRQLFVDDFLIEESSLHREFHRAEYHAASPVLTPREPWETRDPHAINTGIQPSQSAMVFSDGVVFDPADRLFKMFYMAGYQQATALATSRDGLSWHRPRLPIVPGTNIVAPFERDSSTVWLDHESPARESRYKMASYIGAEQSLRLSESADGVRWRTVGQTGRCGDRSTFFRNPFRKLWTFSLRADDAEIKRYRRYAESADFASTRWREDEPVSWIGADRLDGRRADLDAPAELYNLDAVAYESVMLGLFTIFRGEQRTREKPNDICVGFSRDGFHWDRTSREPFITVSERQGDWNWSNVQSAGGCCLIVGDRLYFYVSGRQGIPGTDLPGKCSTGLATLRRDGFASLTDQWPAGAQREIRGDRSSVVTRPLTFRGGYLFVNADAAGELRVEILDARGRLIAPYSAAQCEPVRGDATKHLVRWRPPARLRELSGETVRFRFVLSRARLFSFWIADSEAGRSRGYAAAGGPEYPQGHDAG